MRIFLIVFTFVFLAMPAYAKYECPVEKEKIVTDLMKDIECTHDEECGWFDYGYPWQPSVCMKALVNTEKENHNIAMLRNIEEYNMKCIYDNADEKKKMDDFAQSLKSADCDISRAYCYKGFCRMQGYAIYNDK